MPYESYGIILLIRFTDSMFRYYLIIFSIVTGKG
jgi:hypothetical protein